MSGSTTSVRSAKPHVASHQPLSTAQRVARASKDAGKRLAARRPSASQHVARAGEDAGWLHKAGIAR